MRQHALLMSISQNKFNFVGVCGHRICQKLPSPPTAMHSHSFDANLECIYSKKVQLEHPNSVLLQNHYCTFIS